MKDIGLLVRDYGVSGLVQDGLGEGGAEAQVAVGEVGRLVGDEVEFELLGLTGGVEQLDEDVAAGLDGGGGRWQPMYQVSCVRCQVSSAMKEVSRAR